MSKVTVVDDAQADLKMIEAILTTAGHEVVAYGSGDAIEERLTTERPDVLLLDIVMPKRSGYEVLRAVKKDARLRHTPVVLVSCKNEPSDRAWGERQGADGYVAKPFTGTELLTVITRVTTARPLSPA